MIIKNKKVDVLKYKYLFLNLVLLLSYSISIFANDNIPLKKVSVQLEWKHQFEFAGFYTAIEKGYYKDIGLEVELKEFKDKINISDEVISGKSTFGISSSSLILEKLNKKPVVLLASYFKQNALALAVKEDIKIPSDLKNKKIMALDYEFHSTSIGAMLKDSKISMEDIERIDHNFKIDKFVNGEIDAMSIFITSQPFDLDKSGVKYNILSPADFGLFSYDVELFTSKNVVIKNPKMVKDFIKASNKGWEYAFNNKKEIVDLIYNNYSQRKTKESLIYEANETQRLFKTDIFKIGAVVPELIKLNADMYTKLGLVDKNFNISELLVEYVLARKNEMKDKNIFTKEEKNWLKNNPMVRVAVMNYWNHDGSGNTIHTDYLKLLNRYSDLNIVPVRYNSWKEGYGEAISGNDVLHGIMNLAWSKEREERYFNYSKSYIFEPSYLVVRENNIDIVNLQDLEYKTVLSKEKSITDNIIKDISSNIKIVPIKSDNMMYKRIYSDKNIDAFIAYRKDDKLLKKYNLKVVQTIYNKYSEASIGISKKYQHLESIINKIYKRIPKDELSNIQNKIYNDTTPYKAQLISKNKINFTKEELLYLKNNPSIKVHNELDWAPYNYSLDGKPLGFSIDYMNLLASKIGLNIEYISNYTWNQFLQMIKKNEIDVMLNIAKTSQRDEYLNFTQPYTKAIDAVFVNKDNMNFKTLNDFTGKKIGVIEGFYEEDFLKMYYPNIEVVLFNSSLEALKAVAFAKIDGTINSFGVANYIISQYHMSNIRPAFEIYDKRFSLDLHLATNKNNIMLRDILNKAQQIVTQEEILKLKRKWVGIQEPKENNSRVQLTLKEKQYLQKKRIVTMCIDPKWMPFESFENGKYIGLSADYFKIFEKDLNIPIEVIKTTNWSESLEFAKSRKCDILSLAMETSSRKNYMNFTTPYLKVPLVLATKLEVPFIADMKNLTIQKIGIPKGYAFTEILKTRYPKLNIIEVDNVNDGLKKVKNGELFGYIGTLASVGYLFQREYTGELKIAGKFDDKWKLGVAVRNDDKILLNIFEKIIVNIDERQSSKILNKWIAINYEKGIDYTLVWQIVFIAFLIIVGTIYWNRRLSIVNNELEQANIKVQLASNAKSNFLANMSHEIRTPMNAIIGMSYIVQQTSLDKKQQEYMDKITLSSNALLRLINDILDFSKIEAGKLEIQKVDFNLNKILDDIKNIVDLSVQEKGLSFSVKFKDDMPVNLYGDSLRLSQILTNLISNAIKFTSSGKVELVVEQIYENRFKFSVKDTGIGLNDEQISKLFNSFTQADESTTRKFGGTGLGLSISKELVELMQGKIWCESELNIGSSFIFEVELSKSEKRVEYKKVTNKEIQSVDKKNKEKELTVVSDLEIDKLFNDLSIVAQRRRPNLCEPILNKLGSYLLNESDSILFKDVEKSIKKYKFNDAVKLLSSRDRG